MSPAPDVTYEQVSRQITEWRWFHISDRLWLTPSGLIVEVRDNGEGQLVSIETKSLVEFYDDGIEGRTIWEALQ